MFQKSLILALICAHLTSGMLVKNWGTDSQAKRLAWSTRSFFEDVLKLMTLGQWSVFPIKGVTTNENIQNPLNPGRDKSRMMFIAYNGWLEDLQLNTSGTQVSGRLRRFIMNTAEKHVHEKDLTHSSMKDGNHLHEIIICDECLALQAKGFHYGYEASLDKPEMYSWGTYEKDEPITFFLSFQMTLQTSYNKTTSKRDCLTNLEEIKVTPHPEFWVNGAVAREQRIKTGTFSFLADEIDEIFEKHFNSTILMNLQEKVNGFAGIVIKTNNMCKDFLSGGVFTNSDDRFCS